MVRGHGRSQEPGRHDPAAKRCPRPRCGSQLRLYPDGDYCPRCIDWFETTDGYP
jgi:hypothetical protein